MVVPIEEVDPNWLLAGLDEADQRIILEMIERLRGSPGDDELPQTAVRS